ncbi:MAG TPA: Asp-tRNA(Asn)/Glu-tRNA(Gln) amidotransferase subunit GatA [Vicinamibacterales bacterium]|nr:Asp-tRNA(Asn)/Glu-tRNA(Gln) amidotransferase subunit GatA [Vicinamibacterales bacterium]
MAPPGSLFPASALELREAVRAREISAVEVCRAALDAVAEHEPRLHAFITVCADRALAAASRLDADPARLATLPLAGVPVAVKDNLCTRGLRTTAGSRMLDRFVPPYDATAVRRLEAAGAVVIGKTNCDEFGMGSSTEYSAFGPTRNPWDPARTPGGSSGGSAAIVAAGACPIGLGSDTGGSVRQPASFCGLVGVKPTYGRVSRYGLIAFASSLDQVGTFSRTAADAALVLQAIAGPDRSDATAASRPVPDYTAAIGRDAAGVRVGVPRGLLEEGVDAEVRARFDEAIHALRGIGLQVRDVALPHARYAVAVYQLVATAEASANLARYDGVRYGFRAPGDGSLAEMYAATRGDGFGAEVKRRIMLGTYALSAGYYEAYYGKAQRVRALIRHDFRAAFETVDIVALPTAPSAAFPLGERVNDPLRMYLADVFTAGPSLAGLPAVSVPCGTTSEGLPVGLQLVGRMFDEEGLLRVADALLPKP